MDFKTVEENAQTITTGNVFKNGFAWLVINEYQNMTKEQLKNIIVELDYSTQENVSNAKTYNKIVDSAINELKELEF